jgi:hypothetical protein
VRKSIKAAKKALQPGRACFETLPAGPPQHEVEDSSDTKFPLLEASDAPAIQLQAPKIPLLGRLGNLL